MTKADFQEFMANLPWHMKPENDRERLIMQYTWHAGHNAGIKDGLAKLNESLLRLVPDPLAEAQLHMSRK